MKRISAKLLLALLPALLLLALYFYNDPFKVLYHYDSYFPRDGIQHVALSKDFVSTQNFINKYPQYHYDSYIFGNSRSMYYHVDEWEKHINSARCYHFDAGAESLYGIEKKFRFLHDRGIPIRNALIVFDATAIRVAENDKDGRKHPALTGENRLSYQVDCLKDFFNSRFLSQYITFLLTGKTSSDLYNLVLTTTSTHYDNVTNEVTFPKYEEAIARNLDSFYTARKRYFKNRPSLQQYYPQVIGDRQKELLYSIKKILDENHTSYRLVLSPLYDQKKTDPTDLQFLYATFGRDSVFDFSGINDITQNKYNYYEDSHYRPVVANLVMDSIYHNKL